MNRNNIISLRMTRHGFTKPAGSGTEYEEIFRRLQPVPTLYFCSPGDPPSIRSRAEFDDREYNRMRRRNHEIIKARFQGGTISYVFEDELELYAAAFARPLTRIDDVAMELYVILGQVGPMDKKQLSEEMDLKGGEITKILQKFQKAFMVYEIQPDTFGEQVWQTFESEWPEFSIKRYSKEEARGEIVRRFVGNMVLADFDMVKDWTRFGKAETKEVLEYLTQDNVLNSVFEQNNEYWYLPEDKEAVFSKSPATMEKSVYVLHKADYMVKAYESKLKEEYRGIETLQFLLIDGEIKGTVAGHWRIGPHNVEDILVSLPEEESLKRKTEIINAVSQIYNPPRSRIIKYNGKPV